MQRSMYGHGSKKEVRPLNPERAVQIASELVGECFIFTVGMGAITFEVHRNARSEARKDEARRKELEASSRRIQSVEEKLDSFVKDQGTRIQLVEEKFERFVKDQGPQKNK